MTNKQELVAVAKQVLGMTAAGKNKMFSLEMTKQEARSILGLIPVCTCTAEGMCNSCFNRHSFHV